MTFETPQEKRSAQTIAMHVSSEAMIEKWGADLARYQNAIDRGEKLDPESNRRYLFLRAFLIVSLDRREAVAYGRA